jgi:hypothetical protein
MSSSPLDQEVKLILEKFETIKGEEKKNQPTQRS